MRACPVAKGGDEELFLRNALRSLVSAAPRAGADRSDRAGAGADPRGRRATERVDATPRVARPLVVADSDSDADAIGHTRSDTRPRLLRADAAVPLLHERGWLRGDGRPVRLVRLHQAVPAQPGPHGHRGRDWIVHAAVSSAAAFAPTSSRGPTTFRAPTPP